MEKLKFTAQVFILLAAFPVLFVAGISRQEATGQANNEAIVNHAPAFNKTVEEKNCICKREYHPYKREKMQGILN